MYTCDHATTKALRSRFNNSINKWSDMYLMTYLAIMNLTIVSCPTSGGVSSTFTPVGPLVRPCVCIQLIKLFNIFSSGWDIFLKSSGGIPGMFVHLFQVILNFLHVCQSVDWLTSLVKLYKFRDISSSGRYIFLKFFGDIPGMLVHYFQIIQNFLYVCQSVSWLTVLLKLDK